MGVPRGPKRAYKGKRGERSWNGGLKDLLEGFKANGGPLKAYIRFLVSKKGAIKSLGSQGGNGKREGNGKKGGRIL